MIRPAARPPEGNCAPRSGPPARRAPQSEAEQLVERGRPERRGERIRHAVVLRVADRARVGGRDPAGVTAYAAGPLDEAAAGGARVEEAVQIRADHPPRAVHAALAPAGDRPQRAGSAAPSGPPHVDLV